jgi:hypothetical protein
MLAKAVEVIFNVIALAKLSYTQKSGWEGWARTSDNAVSNRALYQLSYIPMQAFTMV